MLVEMRIRIGGFRNLEPWPEVGGTIELPDHEAADLIVAGYAKEAPDAARPDDEPETDDGGEPTEDAEDEAGPDDGTEADGEEEPLSKADLLARADELDVDVDKRWSAKRIAEAIASA